MQQIDTSSQPASSSNPFGGYDKFLLYCFDRKFSSGIIHSRIWLRQHRSKIQPACLLFLHITILTFFKDKCIFSLTRPSRRELAYKGQITVESRAKRFGTLVQIAAEADGI